MINFRKIPEDDNNEFKYLWRIGSAVQNGVDGMTWDDAAPYINAEWRDDETHYRTSGAYRKQYQCALNFFNNVFADMDMSGNAKGAARELEKERVKLRTEKLEYNKWLREDARDELIAERIADAVKELPPIEFPEALPPHIYGGREGCLVMADAHYGTEFKIAGLFGETINEYSPEIFEERMYDLLNQVVDICEKEGFDTLNVYELGDELDGLLRVSQIWKLRYGVIESTVRYGRFITDWLNELTKHVRVKYQMVSDGNHCQLRMLNQPKNTFKDENMSYIIAEKIMDRLEGNPNFEFIKNPTGYVFDKIAGFNVLGIHGEVKNLAQAIKDFSSTYKTNIDIMIAGHKHHSANEQVGVCADVISVPSIIGVDDFSMSSNKTSNPGATLLVVEEGKGKVVEYNIKL